MKIKELTIYTNNIQRQIDFYSQILNLNIVEKSMDSVCFKVGDSILTFRYRKSYTPYHVAFNIPSNKEIEALKWLKERVEIISFESYELIDFKNWNAKSMYFYDSDLNIIEFISRKDLKLVHKGKFSSNSILSISEIGIGTLNIERVYNDINKLKPIPIFDGNFDKFCALGDQKGLFIVANMKRKTWFPSNDSIHPSEFVIKGDLNFEFKNEKIIEIV